MTREERAQQLWSILVLAARSRQILVYGDIAKACGVPTVSLGGFLEPIQRLCLARHWPPLTAIVVSETTGLPGSGFTAASDVPGAQMQVFQFDWLGIPRAPSAVDFQS